MTEESIADILWARYSHTKYRIPNVFVFDWESDFWFQAQNKYNVEIEIKVSYQDFKKDFDKVKKHQVLKDGCYTRPDFDAPVNVSRRPNKFYYCCPEGIIPIKECPEYAGLMHVQNGVVRTIKEAPFLHKEKIDFRNILCDKFWYYWLEQRRETIKTGWEVDKWKNKYEQLCQTLKNQDFNRTQTAY